MNVGDGDGDDRRGEWVLVWHRGTYTPAELVQYWIGKQQTDLLGIYIHVGGDNLCPQSASHVLLLC